MQCVLILGLSAMCPVRLFVFPDRGVFSLYILAAKEEDDMIWGISMLIDHSAVWGLRAIFFFTRQSFLALMVSAIMSCGYFLCLAVMCTGATFRGAVMTSRMRPPSETLSNAADFMLDAKMQVLSCDVLILLADAQCLCRRWKRWTC